MRVIDFVFLGLAVGILSGCHKEEDRPAVERLSADTLKLSVAVIKNIKVTRAQVGEFPDRLSLMGRISVTEDRMTVVPARVSGRIDAIFLASGEPVQKGQPLVTLFSPDFATAREEYLSALKQEQSQTRVGRSGSSLDFGNLVMMSRKKLETLGLSLADIDALSKIDPNNTFNMRAPRSGVIIDKKAVIGSLVNVGDPLFTIADLSKVWFSGDIYPEDLPKVKKNQEVIIESIVGSQPIYGRVSFISPSVDPTSRSIKIRALMDNPHLTLRTDMYTQGSLILQKREALLIPTSSILRTQQGDFVFKSINETQFKKVKVKTAGDQDNRVAIIEGLTDGDSVVSEGALLLDAALDQR